jgi:EmrB/QacA subfamily drug resistance transporter
MSSESASAPTWLRLNTLAGRGVVLGTVLGSSMAILDGSIVNVALPHIGDDLNAGISGLQWTVNAYLLPLAAFVLLGGALGDRFGRKRVFLVGVIWFALASVLCGIAPSIGLLIGARGLQGLGSALLTPGSLALIQSTLHPDDRARAIGIWAGLGGVAGAAAALLGGYIIDTLNWRWIFFINVPLALITILVTMRFVPESSDRELRAEPFDMLGAVLCALGLGAVTFALVQNMLWLGVVGVAVLGVFVWWERRFVDPMMPPKLFKSVSFSVINLVTFLVYGALGGFFFFFALQLQIVSGYSAFEAGAATLPMTILLLFGSSRAGALGKRIGARLPLTIGAAVAGVGVLLLVRVGPDANYWRDVLGPVTLAGIGMTTLVAPLTSTVLAAVPQAFAGVASGINNAVARSASLLAVAALPLVAGLTAAMYKAPSEFSHSYQKAIVVCACLFAIGSILSFVLLPHGSATTMSYDEVMADRTES